MVNRLSLLGCDMNVTNADGDTPLLVMMRERRLTCIIAMLSNGADCNVQDSKGETVLHLAIKVAVPPSTVLVFGEFLVYLDIFVKIMFGQLR